MLHRLNGHGLVHAAGESSGEDVTALPARDVSESLSLSLALYSISSSELYLLSLSTAVAPRRLVAKASPLRILGSHLTCSCPLLCLRLRSVVGLAWALATASRDDAAVDVATCMHLASLRSRSVHTC